MENGIDLLTQEEFTKQRSNQKFASSKNRIRYNNLKARKKRITKGPIDRTLDQNRTILSRILGDKTEIVVSRDYLLVSCQLDSVVYVLYLCQKNYDKVQNYIKQNRA
jgi:hypothetical protein